MEHWADRARKRMDELGITQEELAPILGVKTRGAVGHYLRKKRKPTPEQLQALAKKLQWSMDELLGESAAAQALTEPQPRSQAETVIETIQALLQATPEQLSNVQVALGLERRQRERRQRTEPVSVEKRERERRQSSLLPLPPPQRKIQQNKDIERRGEVSAQTRRRYGTARSRTRCTEGNCSVLLLTPNKNNSTDGEKTIQRR